MVPSTLRYVALAAVCAIGALFAQTAQQGLAAEHQTPARSATPPADAAARPDDRPRATVTPRVVSPRRAGARPRPRGYTLVRIRAGRSVALRAKPSGAVVGRLTARTAFGSKRVTAVAAVRGRWLGVSVPERPNGKLGWIDGRSDALDRGRTKVALRADLSRRMLELRVGGRVVERMRVAIGRPGSSTPTGRFAVTDKLSGASYGPYYGCCILALSGHQPNTPAGWRGGNRLAIHGTNAPGTVGAAASAGCLRGADRDLRTLLRRVPVGTPVFIRD
jgi:lipoprotein-anchoring transpeptidase ErfK/SrfK